MFFQAFAVFAIVGCSNLVSGQLDFSKCSEYQTKNKACLEQNNIIGTDGTAAAKALDFTRQNSSTCGVISQYKELVTCLVNVSLNCLEGDYKTLFASAENYSSAATYFCSRIGTFDSACVVGSVTELGNCVLDNKATLKEGAGFEELKTYYCATLNSMIDCYTQNTKLRSCEETRTTLIELSKMTKPPACGTIRVVSHILLLILSVVFSKYVCY
ncbi:hypothetical protein SNE40_022928 [Patella caerulea]|uniref:Secreted protein n=1 Tax=Patella caerulea TaxID=87958 RepID=A0AAN8G6B0_PATCE